MKGVSNEEFIEYCYEELKKATDILETVNLATTYRPKIELKNLHKSYDILHNLRNKLRKRVEKNGKNE